MKHLLVTLLALIIGIFVGFGISYTMRQPDTAPTLRTDGGPATSGATNEPTVVFAPGGFFNEDEKSNLTINLIQPLVIYQQTSGRPLASLMINKKTRDDSLINVTAIQQNGAYSEFSHKINEQWIPNCYYDNCRGIPEKFKMLYPELYKKALK